MLARGGGGGKTWGDKTLLHVIQIFKLVLFNRRWQLLRWHSVGDMLKNLPGALEE